MRVPVKLIAAGISIVYGGFVTKLAHDQQKAIDILEKKLDNLTKIVHDQQEMIDILEKNLKKSKKKTKKYKKELLKPPYRRSILPRNGKMVPKQKPKHPIGFM